MFMQMSSKASLLERRVVFLTPRQELLTRHVGMHVFPLEREGKNTGVEGVEHNSSTRIKYDGRPETAHSE